MLMSTNTIRSLNFTTPRSTAFSRSHHWLLLGSDDSIPNSVSSIEQDLRTLFSRMQLTITSLEQGSFPPERPTQWLGIIIIHPLELTEQHTEQLLKLRLQGVPIYDVPTFYETFYSKLPATYLKSSWLILNSELKLVSSHLIRRSKQSIDRVAAVLLLLFVFPIMLATAILIKLDSSGPIFYSQVRTGLNHQPFQVYKFRSMRQDAEKQGAQWAQEHDSRVTRVGRWIRLMRIDELPQIWNVLRGEMSLIGPRPERPEFDAKLAQTIPHYNLRYQVKPGITGWAQVMYPYGASAEDAYEKLAYDLYYIKNYSIWLDMTIVLKTLRVVLLGKGR
jgi:exopolysaccharide biosynthesis polyprenyl glycosylphosphotransferase